MRWDYSVTFVDPAIAYPESGYSSYGVKITKTLYDDNNVELATIEATVEDAKANAGPEFISEFFDTSKQIFLDQVTELFKYSAETGPAATGPSKAMELGHFMTETLAKGLGLTNG